MTNADKAAAIFKEGFSCSMAVLGAYCEQFGLDKNLAYKVSSGFGGGMHLDQTCGAVTGAFMDDLCMGFWGATYPRRGFITHQSQVVASAAAAVRAVSIAGLLGSGSHVVLGPIGFIPSFENDKLELIYPNPSGCIKIGQNPISWESGKLSFSGNYLWVYWRRRICCIY